MMHKDERGVAVIEALVLGVVLLLPMMWLLSVLSSVHSAALGTNSAVREAGMVIARSLGEPDGLDLVVKDALRNHGLDPEGGRFDVHVRSGFVRGAIVDVVLAYEVPVFDPPFLNVDLGPSVTVRSHHSARIDPYQSR